LKNFRLAAKTSSGLEEILANEIKSIGGQNITLGNRVVFYEGDLKIIYKSNYFLRTALRVLKEVDYFYFKNVEQFYLKCKNIDWQKHFGVDQSFVIHSTVGNSKDFTNSMFASLKAKDAIADYFRNKIGKRPNVDTENPEIVIDLHIHGDTCVVSLDSSGESLHKRGYRMNQGEAPLNEVLASGMLQLAGWAGNSDFMDPMCGSGTLPIEAAMLAYNIPAGKFRKNYAFENWNDFDQFLLDDIKKSTTKKDFKHNIFASDLSGSSLLNAQTNARRALVFNKIKFQNSDFKDLQTDFTKGLIIINPPYGERLKERDLTELYAMMGERLKHQYAGSTAWILSSSVESFKHVGLKPEKRLDLYNGALKCKFNKYKMFAGKRNERT
jgi:putative N6-adenine-specific DNA methylase